MVSPVTPNPAADYTTPAAWTTLLTYLASAAVGVVALVHPGFAEPGYVQAIIPPVAFVLANAVVLLHLSHRKTLAEWKITHQLTLLQTDSVKAGNSLALQVAQTELERENVSLQAERERRGWAQLQASQKATSYPAGTGGGGPLQAGNGPPATTPTSSSAAASSPVMGEGAQRQPGQS